MKFAYFAVGIFADVHISFIKLFETSKLAAAWVGPKTRKPLFLSASETPAAKGASGPIITKSIFSRFAKSTTSSQFSMLVFEISAISAIPAFPGATSNLLHFGFCLTAQAIECSRAPLPSIRIFMFKDPLDSIYQRFMLALIRKQGR